MAHVEIPGICRHVGVTITVYTTFVIHPIWVLLRVLDVRCDVVTVALRLYNRPTVSSKSLAYCHGIALACGFLLSPFPGAR